MAYDSIPDNPKKLLLERARTLLLERGWCQRDVVNPRTGSVCLLGALEMAVGNLYVEEAWSLGKVVCVPVRHDMVRFQERLDELAEAAGFTDHGQVFCFNDNAEMTADQVIAYLDQRIKELV